MYAILAFGLGTLALIVERANALYLKFSKTAPDFRNRVLEYIRKGDFKGAVDYSNSNPGSGIARIAAIGCSLKASAAGEEELQSRMDEELTTEIGKLDKRTAFLATMGNIAMLLGLLGTVTGMIISFSAISSASPADRATLLSRGIGEAMNATAFGLLVAIPALVAYAIFQNRVERLVQQLTETTSKIYHDLIFVAEKG